jgi:hypothetical protein
MTYSLLLHGVGSAMTAKRLPPAPKVLAHTVSVWQRKKILGRGEDPQEIAKALFSLIYGFIVQSGLTGEASPEILTRVLKGLLACPMSNQGGAASSSRRPQK